MDKLQKPKITNKNYCIPQNQASKPIPLQRYPTVQKYYKSNGPRGLVFQAAYKNHIPKPKNRPTLTKIAEPHRSTILI